jgi:hypothetical protein
MGIRRAVWAWAGGLALGAALAGQPARGQQADEALKDRVAQLVERLESSKTEAQAAAEKALINLGPKVLPLLPEVTKATGPDMKQRLERIRESLRDQQDQASLDASKVTIRGKGIRLTEAIKQLQAQTGNPITDLREQFGADATNPSLDLDIVDKKFFEALDEIAQKAEVSLNFFTGDESIGLMAGDKPDEIGGKRMAPLYTGPFRVVFTNLGFSRDFGGGSHNGNAQFLVAWEPRLRPMLLALKAEDVKIVDDLGEEAAPAVMDESGNVVLRPENPAAEMNVNMTAPDRKAQKFASLKVKGEVTVPAKMKIFRFPSLAKGDVTIQQGDVSVTLESTEVDEQVWKVNVEMAMPGEGPAFESYRQGLFNNRIWLQRSDGSRFEHNGGFSNTASDGGKLGFEYLFVDAPGKPADYQFVYETPSKVLTIPLEFEFKDVTLP